MGAEKRENTNIEGAGLPSCYGHTPGHTVHYHVIPVYEWTVSAYWQDERYRTLPQLYGTAPKVDDREDFDGADMTLFIWRTFAEPGVEPPAIDDPTVDEVVAKLRPEFSSQETDAAAQHAARILQASPAEEGAPAKTTRPDVSASRR